MIRYIHWLSQVSPSRFALVCTDLSWIDGSRPGKSIWVLWWAYWHWDRFFSKFFGPPLSISFHRDSPHSYITWRMNNSDPGSSVSIVSGYGQDNRAIEIRSPAEAKDFFSILCVQTVSGAHPAFCPTGTGGSYPRG
jgi:hypothetical protein